MKAELLPANGDRPIPITRDITVIGRRDYCDIQIEHPTISKRHCILVRTSGLLILRDLATTNGTKVKGQRIRWAALLPGDKISLGGFKARVYLGPDDTPSPSETHGRRPEVLTGFEAPTPPVVEVRDAPASSRGRQDVSPPSPVEEDLAEAIVLSEDDLIDEDEDEGGNDDDDDDDGWQRLETPHGRDEFFIELE